MDKVRICPADPKGKERLENNTTSYIVNEYMTPKYTLGQLVQSESFHNLHRLRRASDTITVFVTADHWSASDANADHAHSRSWFISDYDDVRWTTIRSDIQVDRYRTGNSNDNNTKGSTLFLYADTHTEPIQAAKIKELSDKKNNFAKPVQ